MEIEQMKREVVRLAAEIDQLHGRPEHLVGIAVKRQQIIELEATIAREEGGREDD